MRKKGFSNFLFRADIVLAILLMLSLALLSPLQSVLATMFPPRFNPIPSILFLLVIIVLVMIGQNFVQRARPQSSSQSNQTPKQEQYLLQRLGERVYQIEIESFLKSSLYHRHPLRTSLSFYPQNVQRSEELDKLHPPTRLHIFDISQAYEQAKDGLLILGGAGGGKSTQLLLLTKQLLEKARDSQQNIPIPVIFSLSEWVKSTSELTDWLVEQLEENYRISSNISRQWVEQGSIQPFLDGLDEVNPKDQQKCIEQINRYRQNHGLVPLVVCCRTDHYTNQYTPLLLGARVEVLPLTLPQVDSYLSEINEHSSSKLHLALQKDLVLRELLSTPLILQICTQTYRTIDFEDILHAGTLEERRKKIFQAYILEMLHHRKPRLYSSEETIRWLSWLAAQMLQKEGITRHAEDTIFRPKRLDPEWFPDHGLTPSWVTFIILSTIYWFFALCFQNWLAFSFALIYTWLFSAVPAGMSDSLHDIGLPDDIWYEVRRSLVVCSICGVVVGLVSGFIWGQAYGLTIGMYVGLGIGITLSRILLYLLAHASLSLLLWRKGYKPFSYSRFLAYTVDCSLLYKRNDGYQFTHRLLQAYFVSLNKLKTSDFGKYEHERFKYSSTLEA